MEEQREQVMVQQQLLFKKEAVCRPSGDMSGRNPHTLGSNRIPQQQDETLNTVTKNRPIDVTHSKVTCHSGIQITLQCSFVSAMVSFNVLKI